MIALLTVCLFFEILVHVLNIASAKARAKTVFGHLKSLDLSRSKSVLITMQCIIKHQVMGIQIIISQVKLPWSITKFSQLAFWTEKLNSDMFSFMRNRPRSIYQYSNMAPRLSGQTSIFGVVFFVSAGAHDPWLLVSEVIYHLPKKSGNLGWNVNGKINFVSPNGNFSRKRDFLKGSPKYPNGISEWKMCVPFVSSY